MPFSMFAKWREWYFPLLVDVNIRRSVLAETVPLPPRDRLPEA